MDDQVKKRCEVCDWEGMRLPLEEDCPACLKPGCKTILCAMSGCTEKATCGEHGEDGTFRMVCYEHAAALHETKCDRCAL